MDFSVIKLHCDTKESITFKKRLTDAMIHQKIALAYISIMTLLVITASIMDSAGVMNKFSSSFSLTRNTKTLFLITRRHDRESYIEWVKFIFMACIIMVHAIISIESPLAAYFVRKLKNLEKIVKKFENFGSIRLPRKPLNNFIYLEKPRIISFTSKTPE